MLNSDMYQPETSQTGAIIDQLALYGATPAPDDTDQRSLPQGDEIDLALSTLFDTTSALMSNSQLEGDLEEMLWSLTNMFHRRLLQLKKKLDDVDLEIKELLQQQDGSEIKSVELERFQSRAAKLYEQSQSYEQMRDQASTFFSAHTGSVWLPRTGSRVSNKGLTASVVDSKSYLNAKRRKETETLCPEGTRIAFAGGDYQDYNSIWKILDAVKVKYPDMILLHGGAPKSAEFIAAKWANDRNVTQVVFKPEWNVHGNAAPFKRNDLLLATVPQGLIAAPGNGVTENLVDKAKKLGINVKRIGG